MIGLINAAREEGKRRKGDFASRDFGRSTDAWRLEALLPDLALRCCPLHLSIYTLIHTYTRNCTHCCESCRHSRSA